ncbi:hypothetical protein, partial [Roseobacter sp.]|uniref:hypothetical protein n=1 Tax=Roseobacter sp. TaxID=1907202 RepID=UPI0025D34173
MYLAGGERAGKLAKKSVDRHSSMIAAAGRSEAWKPAMPPGSVFGHARAFTATNRGFVEACKTV